MGDFVSPKRRAIVDRLRKRIELCRRHHNICQARYDRTQATRFDQDAHETILLHQRVLESRAKKQSKTLKQEGNQHKGSTRCDTGNNSTSSGSEANSHLRNQLLTQKIKRKLETGGSPNAKLSNGDNVSLPNGHDGHPSPKRQCTQAPSNHGIDNGPSLSVSIVQQTGGETIQTNVDVTVRSTVSTQSMPPSQNGLQDLMRHDSQCKPTDHEDALQLEKTLKREPMSHNSCAELDPSKQDCMPNIEDILTGSPMNENMIQDFLNNLMANDPEALGKLERDLKEEETDLLEKLRQLDEQASAGMKQEPVNSPNVPGSKPTNTLENILNPSSCQQPNPTGDKTHQPNMDFSMQDTASAGLTHSEQLKQMAAHKYQLLNQQQHQQQQQQNMNFHYPVSSSSAIKSEVPYGAATQASLSAAHQLQQQQEELKRLQQVHQMHPKMQEQKPGPGGHQDHLTYGETKPLSHMPDPMGLPQFQDSLPVSQNNMPSMPNVQGNRVFPNNFKREPDASAMGYPPPNFPNSPHQMPQQNRLVNQFVALPSHSSDQQRLPLSVEESRKRQKQEYIRQQLMIRQQEQHRAQNERKLREQHRQMLEQQKQEQQQLREDRLRQEQFNRYMNRPPPQYTTRPTTQTPMAQQATPVQHQQQTSQLAQQQPAQQQAPPPPQQQAPFAMNRPNTMPQVMNSNPRAGNSGHHFPMTTNPNTGAVPYQSSRQPHLGHTVQHPPTTNLPRSHSALPSGQLSGTTQSQPRTHSVLPNNQLPGSNQSQSLTHSTVPTNQLPGTNPSQTRTHVSLPTNQMPANNPTQAVAGGQPLVSTTVAGPTAYSGMGVRTAQQQQHLQTQQAMMRQSANLTSGQRMPLVSGQSTGLVSGQNPALDRTSNNGLVLSGHYNGDALQRERALNAALAMSSRAAAQNSNQMYPNQNVAQQLNPGGPGWNQRQPSPFTSSNPQRTNTPQSNITMPTGGNYGNTRINNTTFHNQTVKKQSGVVPPNLGAQQQQQQQQNQLSYGVQAQLNQRQVVNRQQALQQQHQQQHQQQQHRVTNVTAGNTNPTFPSASTPMQSEFGLDADLLANTALVSDSDILDTLNNSDWDEILNKLSA